MTVFISALLGSMIGQAITFWVIGYLAIRQEAKKAEATQEAIRERKMREYARMES